MAGIKKKVAALCLNTKQGYIRGEVSRNYLINGENMFSLDNKDPVSNRVFFSVQWEPEYFDYSVQWEPEYFKRITLYIGNQSTLIRLLCIMGTRVL